MTNMNLSFGVGILVHRLAETRLGEGASWLASYGILADLVYMSRTFSAPLRQIPYLMISYVPKHVLTVPEDTIFVNLLKTADPVINFVSALHIVLLVLP